MATSAFTCVSVLKERANEHMRDGGTRGREEHEETRGREEHEETRGREEHEETQLSCIIILVCIVLKTSLNKSINGAYSTSCVDRKTCTHGFSAFSL